MVEFYDTVVYRIGYPVAVIIINGPIGCPVSLGHFLLFEQFAVESDFPYTASGLINAENRLFIVPVTPSRRSIGDRDGGRPVFK